MLPQSPTPRTGRHTSKRPKNTIKIYAPSNGAQSVTQKCVYTSTEKERSRMGADREPTLHSTAPGIAHCQSKAKLEQVSSLTREEPGP